MPSPTARQSAGNADTDDPPPTVRLSVVTLGIPFFTHLLGLAATWAALKQLQILWICDEVLGPEQPENPVNGTLSMFGPPLHLLDRCDAPEVQATASAWFTALSLCYNVPSLVLVPIFGYYLDRWSRKKIILVAMSFSSGLPESGERPLRRVMGPDCRIKVLRNLTWDLMRLMTRSGGLSRVSICGSGGQHADADPCSQLSTLFRCWSSQSTTLR